LSGSLFPEIFEAPGFCHLPGFARAQETALLAYIDSVTAISPFRKMSTPGGKPMSAAMTNCGGLGWVSDRRGYRYEAIDPLSFVPWPAMPDAFSALASHAAAQAGYENFAPDACLINRYEPGASMALHQDRDEQNFAAPIVSVSLGLPIIFLWGGATRAEKPAKIRLFSGDVVVWGGPARLNFHGVVKLAAGLHPIFGPCRINLTFRQAA
jgi:alkylated DNA repair protein (DNA oxidative demethylase)